MNDAQQLEFQVKDLEEKCQYQDQQIIRLINEVKEIYSSNQQLTQQILNLDSIVNQLIIENQQLKIENEQFNSDQKQQSNLYSQFSDQDFFEPNNEIQELINQKQKQLKILKSEEQKSGNEIIQKLQNELHQEKIANLQMDISALQQLQF